MSKKQCKKCFIAKKCKPSSETLASQNLFAGGGSYLQFAGGEKAVSVRHNKMRYAYIVSL